jgi:hypothetical protein
MVNHINCLILASFQFKKWWETELDSGEITEN